MRCSAKNLRALLATGALIKPIGPIYAETISVTPHTECSAVMPIKIATPNIDRPEVAPILIARAEIASIEVENQSRRRQLKQETVAELPQAPIALSCPSPSPIGVRYAPDLRRQMEADYKSKLPRDPPATFLRQAATKVEMHIWQLGVSTSGRAFLSAFVTNQNDFALQQITLRCEYATRHGPMVILYKLLDVFEPVSLGPATINYTDHYLGAAPLDAGKVDCAADEVALWSPGEDVQSRR